MFYQISLIGRLRPDRPMIVIHCQSNMIPNGIDKHLMRSCALAHLDGPNHLVSYEFRTMDDVIQAERFLQDCGWSCKETT